MIFTISPAQIRRRTLMRHQPQPQSTHGRDRGLGLIEHLTPSAQSVPCKAGVGMGSAIDGCKHLQIAQPIKRQSPGHGDDMPTVNQARAIRANGGIEMNLGRVLPQARLPSYAQPPTGSPHLCGQSPRQQCNHHKDKNSLPNQYYIQQSSTHLAHLNLRPRPLCRAQEQRFFGAGAASSLLRTMTQRTKDITISSA